MGIDVLILGFSKFHDLKDHLEELCIDFEIGKKRSFFPVDSIHNQLREAKALALLFFQ